MSPQTVKLLMMFFFAALLLNVTNYLFYVLYDPPSRHAMKLESWNARTARYTPKHRYVHTIRWTAFLLAKELHESTPNPIDGEKSGSVHGDYGEQSSEVSAIYEFKGLERCPQKPPGLGPVNSEEVVSLEAIEKLYETLGVGGVYEETECAARQTVAIIIPYRGQKSNLLKFLYSLHPILIKQQLDYQIFVIEQNITSTPMNRGKLLNAGFSEAQRIHGLKKETGWKCVVFHDPELVPVDSRNLYRCSKNPHQLVNVVNNRTYEQKFGGAIAVNPAQFAKVNGFSNLYSENEEGVYEDLYKRFVDGNYTVTRSTTFGKYSYLKQEVHVNQTRFQTIHTSSPLNLIDGLSTLTYTLEYHEAKQLYTSVKVNIDASPKSNSTEKTWNRLLSQATIPTAKTQIGAKIVAKS